MTDTSKLMIAASVAAAALLAGCAAVPSAEATGPTESKLVSEAVLAADPPAWPATGCPDAAGMRQFWTDPANKDSLAYFGLYSDGNVFWIGNDSGNNVFNPKRAFRIPKGKQPYVMRWTIADAPRDGQPVNINYSFDDDPALNGGYAVNAFAVNQCMTDQLGGYGSCDQPIFGKEAWQKDAEFCPPVILPEDPDSVYLWDRNLPRDFPQVYEYSLALVLKGKGPNDPKAGIRIIVDPKVQNGGQN